jgi:hypothetical protein
MQHIQTVTVGSGGAASITFSSIPATFTDLELRLSLRSDSGGHQDFANIQLNGDTAANYFFRWLSGNGSSASSLTAGAQTKLYGINVNANGATASTFGNGSVYFPNYTSSSQKSVSADTVNENNATSANQVITALLWTGTVAISSMVITPDTGSLWQQYSSASLYGILAGSDGVTTVS